MEIDKSNINSLMSEAYKDTEFAGSREEAMTGEAEEFEFEGQEQTTTEEPVAEEQEVETEETEEIVAESEESEETALEESSLNSDESSAEESTTEPTFNFDEEFAKRTEGKFNSFEEMMEAATKQTETTQHEYGNELIAKLDELAKQGVNVDLDFVTSQMVDYTSYDVENTSQALELIKKEFKLNEPDITDRELKFELSERYKLDEDLYDEDDIERSKLRLMRDAKKAVKALQESQKNMALPKGGVDPEKQAQIEAQQKAAQEQLFKTLKNGLDEYQKESLTIGDETFNYELKPEAKKSLENTIMNTDKFFNQYINNDGSVAVDRLNSDMMWANPKTREVMLKAFLQQATAKGSSDVVKDIKNTSLDKKSPKTVTSSNPIQTAISKHFEGRRF